MSAIDVEAALEQLGSAAEALGIGPRLHFAQLTLSQLQSADVQPQERPIWGRLHVLVNDGATPERLAAVESALAVVGPAIRAAVAAVAAQAVVDDAPRAALWAAVRQLADAIGGAEDA